MVSTRRKQEGGLLRITSIFLILTTVACSTPGPRLLEETYKVRIVTSSPQNCKYLGRVVGRWSGVYWTGDEAVANARVDMMNQAASTGVNTIEVTNVGLEGASSAYSVGEGYFCKQ